MENLTETPLIDLAPKMFAKIKAAQVALSKWVQPYSTESIAEEVLLELLEILDDRELVEKMNQIEGKKERPELLKEIHYKMLGIPKEWK
jgi:hypothetical protein